MASTRSSQNPHNTTSSTTVPPGAPEWVTSELIEYTIRVWERYYSAALTPEDALEIIQSSARLFQLLSQDPPT